MTSYASWGTYLAASIFLVGVMAPTLQGVSAYSSRNAAITVLDGVADVLNNLSPGVTAALGFHGVAGNLSVRLGGNLIIIAIDGSSEWRACRWPMQDATLSADSRYSVMLVGGIVEVSRVV